MYRVDDFLASCNPRRGLTLVAGSRCYGDKPDRRLLYGNAVGLDLETGPGVDMVHDLHEPLHERFDHIDCVSVLEHVERPWDACRNLENALKPGGTIFLCVPFAWRVHNYPADYWRFTIQSFGVLFPNIRWEKRGYIAQGPKMYKITPKMEDGEIKGITRSEAVGFGRKCAES